MTEGSFEPFACLKTELIQKLAKHLRWSFLFTNFTKSSILDVRQGSEYFSDLDSLSYVLQ